MLDVTLDDGRTTDDGRTECEDRARILETEFAITKTKTRSISEQADYDNGDADDLRWE